jgi:hypothetical protein
VALADSSSTTTTETTTTPTSSTTTSTTTTTQAPAAAPVAPAAPATTAATDPENEVICKSTGPDLGTRIGGHRICKTKHDWDAQHTRSEEEISNYQHTFGNSGGH